MDKLNVCLLNDSFPPAIDGVANATINYARFINQNHGKAIVATPKYPGVKDHYDFDVLRYPSINTTKLVGYRAGVPLNLNFLSKFNDYNIDIIHSHCPVSSTLLARTIREQIHKPIVMTYHTKFDIDLKHAVNNKLITDAAIKVMINNIEAVDEVWCVSSGAAENLKSLGYSKEPLVMGNGVDFPKGKTSEESMDKAREILHLNKEIPTYLFVGRMMWYKGIKIILDALSEVKKHDIDFNMIFVGNGNDLPEIKEYAEAVDVMDKCQFTGAIIDREYLRSIYSVADIFLFPSTYDTNGIVVREAAASGLASIIIKNSCAAEDTVDGVNTIQIEENYEDLAKVLISVGYNLEYFHQIGRNAQSQIYTSWEDAVAKGVARYHEVINNFEYNSRLSLVHPTDNAVTLLGNLSKVLSIARKQHHAFIDIIDGKRVFKVKDEDKEHISDNIDRYL